VTKGKSYLQYDYVREWSSVRDVAKNHTCFDTNMIPDNKLTTAAAKATDAWPHNLLLPDLHHLQNMAE
jgi:hypothetical protein